MATASTLEEAAYLSYEQLGTAWAAGTLGSATAAFVASVQPIFDDQVANDRTVGNWIVLITALAAQGPSSLSGQDQFPDLVDLVFRMCMAGHTAADEQRITSGQHDALLAAWNGAFGTA